MVQNLEKTSSWKMGCRGFLARVDVVVGDAAADAAGAGVGGVIVLLADVLLLDGTGDRRALVAAEKVSTASAIGAGIKGKTVSPWDAIVLKSAGHANVCKRKVVEEVSIGLSYRS